MNEQEKIPYLEDCPKVVQQLQAEKADLERLAVEIIDFFEKLLDKVSPLCDGVSGSIILREVEKLKKIVPSRIRKVREAEKDVIAATRRWVKCSWNPSGQVQEALTQLDEMRKEG